ncbi:MAG: hypothetical protein BWY37_01574 [Firmicutes bacterium ADurb.Bin262]|nr:MAG: hypothetical protein BWY37_01574 [Firmicutes bacterium ADurb.Bin262]
MPERIASTVFLPAAFVGACRLILGSWEVLEASASRDMATPGAMVQPQKAPFESMMLIFVAVPRSAARQGRGYIAAHATAAAMRSAPTWAGLSVKIFSPVFSPGPRITGWQPVSV